MYRPPRPRATAAGEAGIRKEGARWSAPISQFVQGLADPDAIGTDEGRTDVAGVGLMHHQVVPPTGLDGRMPQEHQEVIGDDMSSGAMDSGSYFTNLLVNDVEESQGTNDHAPVVVKGSQGRSKNFRDEEDILLVSAWLNVGPL